MASKSITRTLRNSYCCAKQSAQSQLILTERRTFTVASSSVVGQFFKPSNTRRALSLLHRGQNVRSQLPARSLRSIQRTAGTSRSLFIQTETTPNPDSLKFNPGLQVLPPRASSIEYVDGRDTYNSPLARKLFQLDGVQSVFYGPDFITITKSPDANWTWLKPEVFSLITEFLNDGQSVVDLNSDIAMAEDTKPQEDDSEVVSMIKELLETRIRPAIQEDGGDIEYRGFDENGMVLLKLRGACRTCDSSTVTLKAGIESMLMHYVEEVKGVIQVLDQEEEIAMKEFEKFEASLKKMKGPEAVAGTGPGGLDSAPA